ncbi:hypothetical protein SCUCBS95973_006883 [Sporothrix curviconia]|uniref:Non-structural maintenance of chromosomes element 1 homolog n=1 Tax=Sporothrix curviconia TaxID=1260050 RepID=A0ABP0CA02_9PEZI
MPQPNNRKRARSDAEPSRPTRRRSRREDDDAGDDDNRQGEASGGGDGGYSDGGSGAQTQGARQPQRAWRLPPGYDDSNRAFLQALMAHGALTFQQAQQVLAHILAVKKTIEAAEDGQSPSQGGSQGEQVAPEDVTYDMLRHYINQAKAALAPLDFDIRSATNERPMGSGSSSNSSNSNDHRVWVLVSTDNDPKSHLAVLFTPRKLAFLHRMLDALFDTYNTPRIEALCITEQQALKLSRPPRTQSSARQSLGGGGRGDDAGEGSASQAAAAAAASRDKGLKHSVVLSLLASLVRQGWLSKSAQGFYALTTRALLELEPFLIETYNEPEPARAGAGADAANSAGTWQRIKYCAACRELITSGLRCATPTCMLRVHDHCEEVFWRTQRGRNNRGAGGGGGDAERHRCPKCDAPWGKAEDANGEVEGKLHFIGERAITSTDIYRRKKRQGKPSEGVDDLMSALQPRSATGGRRGRDSEVASPFRQAAAAQSHASKDNDEGDEV